MEYLTEDYSSNRTTPNHSLTLPLKRVGIEKYYPPPTIGLNRIFYINVNESLLVFSERSFELISTSIDIAPIVGATFTETGVITELDDKSLCVIDNETLAIKTHLAEGSVFTSKMLITDIGFLVFRQEGEGWSAPLSLSLISKSCDKCYWSFFPEHPISGFALENDQVVITDSMGGIYALDLLTGNIRWQQDVYSLKALTELELNFEGLRSLWVRDNPHIYHDTICFGYLFDYLIGVDLHTGTLKWKYKVDTSIRHTSVTANGHQYYVSSNSRGTKLAILDCRTGTLIREVSLTLPSTIKDKFTSSAYSDVTTTHFWGVSGKGLLFAINLETGNIDWSYDLEGNITENPFFICNNRLYITTFTEQFIFEGAGGYIL